MRLPLRAGLLVASIGLVAGLTVGTAIYTFLLQRPLVEVGTIVFTLAALTSLVSGLVAYLFVQWRIAHSLSPMGPRWGALLGFGVFTVVTFVHALMSPGAAGVVASFLGQLAIVTIFAGWLAILIGALLGYVIDQFASRKGA